MKRIASLALSSLITGIVLTAATPASADDITGTLTTLKIQAQASGNSFFTMNQDLPYYGLRPVIVGKCLSPTGSLFLIPDDDRGKAMIAILLGAWLSGKQITAGMSDGGSPTPKYCFVSYVNAA